MRHAKCQCENCRKPTFLEDIVVAFIGIVPLVLISIWIGSELLK